MVWMRLIIIILIIIASIVTCFVLGVMMLINRHARNRAERGRRNRIDVVKDYVKKKARKFDPASHPTDTDVDCCVICLEPYLITDNVKVVQLNCNSKHLFHLKCINEWLDKNDICPMCR